MQYHFGSEQGYISAAGEAVEQEEIFDGLSLGFLLPESFYHQIPDAASAECSLLITTYASGEVIGTAQTAFTATAGYDACAPVLKFVARDINEKTLALTGNQNIFIRGQSLVKCYTDIEAQKGASVTSVTVNGGPETEYVPLTGYVEVTATDSRGYTAQKRQNYRLVAYGNVTCHAQAQRESSTSDRVRLQVWGQYFDGTFGAQRNALTLRCNLPDGRQVELPFTASEGNYQAEAVLTGLSYQSAHALEVVAEDLLSSASRMVSVNRGIPVFDWGENDFVFHVPVTAEGGIGGAYLHSFSGSSVWLTPQSLPQSYLIGGNGVLGVLTVTADGCDWQGTQGVVPARSENSAGLVFPGDTAGVILSHAGIQ